MKKLPLLALVICLYSSANAQKINVFKSGSIEQHEVNWAAESGIRVERNKFIRHDKIDSIQIIENGKLSGQLARFYIITRNSANYQPPSPLVVTTPNTDYQQPVTTVSDNSHPGAALELLGALALTAYFVLSNSYVNEVRNNPRTTAKPPSGIIPAAGAGALSIGFIIDLSAGSKKK